MKKRYELRFDGKVIDSESLHLLRRIANGTSCYYELYVYYMPTLDKGTLGNQKVTIADMQDMVRQSDKGYNSERIARKFGIKKDTVLGILKKMRSKENLKTQ